MVVPYLRNPKRHKNTPAVIKPKSQYHLEPDHTTINEPTSTSAYKHVGRRTKGGSGGGYLYSSSSSQYKSSSSGNRSSSCTSKTCEEVGAIFGYVFLGIFGLIVCGRLVIWIAALDVDTYRYLQSPCCRRSKRIIQERHRRQEAVRRLEERARRQEETQISRGIISTPYGADQGDVWHVDLSARDTGNQLSDPESPADPTAPRIATVQEDAPAEGSTMEEILKDMDRMRLIRSKLHYQVVLPDMSNTTAQSIRDNINNNTTDTAKADDATEASFDDEDDDSVIGTDETKALSGKKPVTKKHASNASSSSFYFTLRNFLSFRPTKHEDCSICLESFAECQTICVAKNSCCEHSYHQECLESWLMNHDDCPNCRSNMIDEE